MKASFVVFVSLLPMTVCVLESCSNEPSKVDVRKAEIRAHDSIEIIDARKAKSVADSIIAFKEFEVEDLKKEFVFEKKPEYQTLGYYVLPGYAGDKSKYDFFPEVEEQGKLLYVSIDKKRNYTFKEVDVMNVGYEDNLPKGVSSKVKEDAAKCYLLAKAMQELAAAKDAKEKAERKVKFYEKKMEIAAEKLK